MIIRWQEITAVDHPFWRRALALYDAAFPLEVREPHSVFSRSLQQKSALHPSSFHFLIGIAKRKAAQTAASAEQVAALAVVHYLAEVNWGFLVYLLVAPDVRGQGIGYALHTEVERILQADAQAARRAPLRGLVLETEKEEHMQAAEEIEASRRRTRFFLRLGYQQLANTRYLQPPLHPNSEAVPLHLFVKLFADQPALTATELRQVVLAMYREKYGRMNRIAPAILQACAASFQADLAPAKKRKASTQDARTDA